MNFRDHAIFMREKLKKSNSKLFQKRSIFRLRDLEKTPEELNRNEEGNQRDCLRGASVAALLRSMKHFTKSADIFFVGETKFLFW